MTTQADRGLYGRDRERSELERALADAREGHGSLFLIGGEPGMGKTALAEELAAGAAGEGAVSLSGRCWEAGGAPPYWPWVQVLRGWVREHGPGALASGPAAKLVPELPQAEAEGALDPDSERFALFDSVASFLRDASEEAPLVVVLDDIHAADEPSLLLLEFLTRELRSSRALVLGTYRPGDGDAASRAVLGRLVGDGKLLTLAGLDPDGVGEFVRDRAGEVPPAGVTALHEATDGNPFYLEELVRLLRTEGLLERPETLQSGRLPVPEGVRETVRARLGPLSEGARAVLRSAAALGKEFSFAALEHTAELDLDALLELLDEGVAQDVIVAVPGGLRRYRFAHAVVREVLHDELGASARAETHRRVGEALERLYAADPQPHLTELAHHFLEAVPAGGPDRAIDYSAAAGNRAILLLAYEEAVRHYENALQALELQEPASPQARCELLLALGEARRKAGDPDGARETYGLAADLAARLRLPRERARAALGFAGRYWTTGVVDDAIIEVLEGALPGLGEDEPELRAAVLARLATELYYSPSRERAGALSEEAVAIAEASGDAGALASVLDARLAATWRPENLDERLELSRRVVDLAEGAGDRETALRDLAFHVSCLLERGDVARADAAIEAARQRAEHLRQPRFLWHVTGLRALRALMRGRWEEGEQLAEQALEAGRHADESNAVHYYGIQLATARYGPGKLDQIEAPLKAFVDRYPQLAGWRCTLALLYAELGRREEAARELELAGAGDWSDLARDSTWLLALCRAADASALIEVADGAPRLYELLEPYAERNVVLGRVASISIGSSARYLGLLAGLMERWDDAAEHFEQALELNARMGARPWLAHTRQDYARMLLRRDAAGDREHAGELLDGALALAEELGMERVAETTRALMTEPAAEPQPAAPPRTDAAVFRPRGDYWEVGFEGSAQLLKDVKGLGYIAELLRHPGDEFHAADLVAGGEPAAAGAARTQELDERQAGSDDAGELLDAQAKAAYKARLEELREELAEAEEWGDPERASRAREEMDTIAQELAAAVGLGGRDRKAASTAERARVNVTRAIRSAIARVEENDAPLGRYLDTAIRTGTFCSYQPDARAPVAWSL